MTFKRVALPARRGRSVRYQPPPGWELLHCRLLSCGWRSILLKKMPTGSRWKRSEREVAARLGGVRNPCDGRERSDVTAGPFAVEVKTRKSLPKLITSAMEQAERAARPGQTPMVALVEVRQGVKARRYIVMKLADWCDWHGKPCAGSPEG